MSVSQEAIDVYVRCGGDPDYYCRSRNRRDEELISDDEWLVLDDLVQRLAIIQSGHAAAEFEHETNQLLAQCPESSDARRKLLGLTAR